MPRSTQRQVLLRELHAIVQQLIHLMVYDSGEDLMDLLKELWEVYKILAARRYIAARKTSAGRHFISQGSSVLEDRCWVEFVLVEYFAAVKTWVWLVTALWSAVMSSALRESWVMARTLELDVRLLLLSIVFKVVTWTCSTVGTSCNELYTIRKILIMRSHISRLIVLR